VAQDVAGQDAAAIISDTVNNRAAMRWITNVTGGHNMFYTFIYHVHA
jgi:hypothetical protein